MSGVAMVNGVALHRQEERPAPETLRELAWGELLRQEAVRAGLLADAMAGPATSPMADPVAGTTGSGRPGGAPAAPVLGPAEQAVIEAMLQRAVTAPEPGDEECRRHYEADRRRFVTGQAAHLRHILFAVTPGIDVRALAARAEAALKELSARNVDPGRFARLAAELSNCPSGAAGGDLGWVGPQDCAPELAAALFQREDAEAIGLRPRLVHSRHGLHIVEVIARRPGRLPPYEAVRERIAAELAVRARATFLHRYMKQLAGTADVTGVEL